MSARENWRAECDQWLTAHRVLHDYRTPTVAELEAHFLPTCGSMTPNVIYGFMQALHFSVTGQLQPITTEEPASATTIETAWGIAKPARARRPLAVVATRGTARPPHDRTT